MIDLIKEKSDLLKLIKKEKIFLEKYKLNMFSNDLKTLEERCENLNFRINVMGAFASGKGSFINALLQKNILPTRAIPLTAVLTEVRYGENDKIKIHSKENGKEFEDVGGIHSIQRYQEKFVKDFTKFYEISTEKPFEMPFDKITVYSDSDILKKGVVISEIPFSECGPPINGLPYFKSVEKYCTTCDLIMYCISVRRVLSADDKYMLEEIKNYSCGEISIVTTFFDVIMSECDDNEKKELMDYTCQSCSQYTSSEKCFFVSSKVGQEAIQTDNEDLWIESGLDKVEKFIEDCFVNSMEQKLKSIKNIIRKLNRKIKTIISVASDVISLDSYIFDRAVKRVNELMPDNSELYEQCVAFIKNENDACPNNVDKRKLEYEEILSFIETLKV